MPGRCFMPCTECRVAAAQLRGVHIKAFKSPQLVARAGVLLCDSGPDSEVVPKTCRVTPSTGAVPRGSVSHRLSGTAKGCLELRCANNK